MKLKQLDVTSAGEDIFVMHIGRREATLIMSLASEALIKMPKMGETTQLRRRLNQIRRDIYKALENNFFTSEKNQ